MSGHGKGNGPYEAHLCYQQLQKCLAIKAISEGSEITGTLMGRVSVAKPDVGAIEIAIAIGFDAI